MQSFTCKLNKEFKKLSYKNPHCVSLFCQNPKFIQCGEHKGFQYEKKDLIELVDDFGLPHLKKKDYTPSCDLYETIKDVEKVWNGEKYRLRNQRCSTQLHIGQLKLFLSTLQFLTLYCDTDKINHIIYPGSAPGNNIPLLCDMFPNTRWYLCDPRPIEAVHENIVWLKNDFFLEEHMDEINSLIPEDEKKLLISDIRISSSANLVLTEEDIDNDMGLQRGWVEYMKPDFAQLKFRLPRLMAGNDVIGSNGYYKYLHGKLYLQYFAPISSTELRLVVNGKDLAEVDWNVDQIDNLMFLFNGKLRVSFYDVPEKVKKATGFDSCHDCWGSYLLIKHYCELYNRDLGEIFEYIWKIGNVKRRYIQHDKMIKNSLK